jgi:(1->4)-alpha-D-glucan 1-alpha-D-glucosylmutase
MQIPVATYRIQFHKDFGFAQANDIVDYLHRLGIQVIYASPIFKAGSGSTHGYDVADPNQINPEVGTEEELNQLFASLRKHNMGWLQDIVPNHMVFSTENALLMDVLEKGYHSPYGRHFDIGWNHPSQSLKHRLLVPFLGVPYYEALHEGQLELIYRRAGSASSTTTRCSRSRSNRTRCCSTPKACQWTRPSRRTGSRHQAHGRNLRHHRDGRRPGPRH